MVVRKQTICTNPPNESTAIQEYMSCSPDLGRLLAFGRRGGRGCWHHQRLLSRLKCRNRGESDHGDECCHYGILDDRGTIFRSRKITNVLNQTTHVLLLPNPWGTNPFRTEGPSRATRHPSGSYLANSPCSGKISTGTLLHPFQRSNPHCRNSLAFPKKIRGLRIFTPSSPLTL